MTQWRGATYGVRVYGNGTHVAYGDNGEEYRLYPAAGLWHGGDGLVALNTGHALAYDCDGDMIVVAMWWGDSRPTWTSIAWRAIVSDSEAILRCAQTLLEGCCTD